MHGIQEPARRSFPTRRVAGQDGDRFMTAEECDIFQRKRNVVRTESVMYVDECGRRTAQHNPGSCREASIFGN